MTAQPQQLTLRRPDDWHIHLRDDEMLNTVLPYTSAVNGRAIVMPNLVPPRTQLCLSVATELNEDAYDYQSYIDQCQINLNKNHSAEITQMGLPPVN